MKTEKKVTKQECQNLSEIEKVLKKRFTYIEKYKIKVLMFL